jgi:hypothetical protein
MARSIVCRDAGVRSQAASRRAGGAASCPPAIVEGGLGKARAGDAGGTPPHGSRRAAEHGRASPAAGRPTRHDARATSAAQGARGVGRKPFLRFGAGSGPGELRRLDPAWPSPTRARDTGGNPPRTHRCSAPERSSRSRRGCGVAASDRVRAWRLARAGAGVRGRLDRDHRRRGQLHASAARFGRLWLDRRR